MQKDLEVKNEVEPDQLYNRIKKIFQRDSVSGDFNPRLFLISQCVFAGSIAGFFIGGRIGARIGAVEHIEGTNLTVYRSTVDAQRHYQSKIALGFVRNGCKFGWRAGVFSGLYSLLMVLSSEANPTYGSLNYLAAGAGTGIVYKSLAGWRSMVVGAVVGAGLSAPVSVGTYLINQLAPEEMRQQLDVFGSAYTVPKPIVSMNTNEEISPSTELSLDDVIGQLESQLAPDDESNSQ